MIHIYLKQINALSTQKVLFVIHVVIEGQNEVHLR